MASNGEPTSIDKLCDEIEGLAVFPRSAAIRSLVAVARLQQERIGQLEQEIYSRCDALRQRVAQIEQSR